MTYATLDELKNRLRRPYTDATQDEWLQTLLQASTDLVGSLAGHRRFAVTEEETRLVDCSAEFIMGNILRLPEEMHTISGIVNGDGVAITADDFVTRPRMSSIVDGAVVAPTTVVLTARPFYEVQLKTNGRTRWTYRGDWEGAISVTGCWGYSPTPPAPIRVATLDLATHIYKLPENIGRVIVSPDGVILTPDAIPSHVVGAVAHFARVI